jgi:superfamily II RNA helicase
MPTKTVCFTSIYKRDSHQRRVLYPHEFIQMSGRAGRRNIDTVGHVILLTNLYEPLETTEMKKLLYSPPKVLKSKFKMGYSLLLHEGDRALVEKSLMMVDIRKQIERADQDIVRLSGCIEENVYDLDLIMEYVQCEERLPLTKNKSRTEIVRRMKQLETPDLMSHMSRYKLQKEYLAVLEKAKEQKQYALGYIDQKIEAISGVLAKHRFYETPKWEVAKTIHEVHPLVLTDLLIKTDFFRNYSAADLFSLLSCFCEVKVEESLKLLNPVRLKEECLYVKTRMDVYIQEEWFFDLSESGQDQLQYDMMEFVQAWMGCEDEASSLAMLREVVNQKGIFVGDFIKCCLKLVNVAKELDRIERLDFREKLREGSQLLMKFICTHDSLYL